MEKSRSAGLELFSERKKKKKKMITLPQQCIDFVRMHVRYGASLCLLGKPNEFLIRLKLEQSVKVKADSVVQERSGYQQLFSSYPDDKEKQQETVRRWQMEWIIIRDLLVVRIQRGTLTTHTKFTFRSTNSAPHATCLSARLYILLSSIIIVIIIVVVLNRQNQGPEAETSHLLPLVKKRVSLLASPMSSTLFERTSKAQWKALSLAYPLYVTALSNKDEGQLEALVRTFLEDAIPRIRSAFRLPDSDDTDAESKQNDGREAWRQAVPRAVDELLGHLFGLESLSAATTAVLGRPLDASEITLLHIIHKERERVDRYYNLYLLAEEELKVFREELGLHRHQIGASAAPTSKGSAQKEGHATVEISKVDGEMYPWKYTPLPPNTALEKKEGQRSFSGVEQQSINSAVLPPSSLPAAGALSASRGLADQIRNSGAILKHSRPPPVLSPMMEPRSTSRIPDSKPVAAQEDKVKTELICEECLEPGDDLYCCSHCRGLRHEACGGPHPPSSYKSTGGEPPLMLCKSCAKAMELTSSSSSLRSSTSTDEREELGSLLDEDDDSSMSGFIASSTEEDEDEGATTDDRESMESHRSSAGAPVSEDEEEANLLGVTTSAKKSSRGGQKRNNVKHTGSNNNSKTETGVASQKKKNTSFDPGNATVSERDAQKTTAQIPRGKAPPATEKRRHPPVGGMALWCGCHKQREFALFLSRTDTFPYEVTASPCRDGRLIIHYYDGEMGRSNNQMRRTAKAKGKPFIPKQVKSKVRNQARKLKIMAVKKDPRLNKKLSYDKVKTKTGKIKQRKFRSGGYNSSGKFGKATGAKMNAKKGSKKHTALSRLPCLPCASLLSSCLPISPLDTDRRNPSFSTYDSNNALTL
eukprot:gene3956-2819_t